MPQIPQLQLLVPGLCGPLPDIQRLYSDENCLTVFSELAKARVNTLDSDSLYLLLTQFFLIKGTEEFPSAALSLLACAELPECKLGTQSLLLSKDEIQNLLCDYNYFLHADPVHLHADMDHAILMSAQDLNLSIQEAQAFSQQLQDHFKQDELKIFAIDASHWYLCTKEPQSLITTSLNDAIGRNVNFIMPSGDDSAYWKQFLNESQMLLFMHECNQQREKTGQLAVNSVWLHGGGDLPDKISADKPVTEISAVYSDDVLLQGLAQYYNLPCHDITNFYGAGYTAGDSDTNDHIEQFYAKIKNQTKPLLYINTLLPWLNYTDSTMWQQQVLKFYQQWLKPLLVLVRQGKLKVELYPCNNKKFNFNRFYSYRLYSSKFWRKAKIEDYVSTYS